MRHITGVAKVDTVLHKFIGEVNDFWANDTVMIKITYDLKGDKDGLIKVTNPNGGLILEGQYIDGNKVGNWEINKQKQALIDFSSKKIKANRTIDSLEMCLLRKRKLQC